MIWIRVAQQAVFYKELSDLSKDKTVFQKSCLRSLNPFLDANGLIRVGKRLVNSHLAYYQKHPLVLPARHEVTRLLFKLEHIRLLHYGPQSLLAHMHIRYWPLRGRSLARSSVHKCVRCFRASPLLSTPIMAPLPRSRVTIDRPFARSGVDFCGPISIRSGIRRVTSTKGYVAVFVCFATKYIMNWCQTSAQTLSWHH